MDNFSVDYNRERLIFTVKTGNQTLSWTVVGNYIFAYPKFKRITDYELYYFYTHWIVPKIQQYYKFVKFYATTKIPDDLTRPTEMP
jgi:hypothetical protein